MSTAAIELNNVNKSYRYFALSDISLQLEPGHIMGFIGPNGAGKSTTIRLIMGLVHADSGDIRVLGHAMPVEQVAAKWGIGFASEDMNLYKAATLEWHMGFMQSIYADWDKDYARQLVDRFDLRPEQRMKGMSHGQKVKSGLLLALARRPRLLVLDEPTTGLDPVARTEVLNELMEVLVDEDRSVLFSSHNTNDVEQISDKITFIDRGRIIEAQDKESFLDRWRRVRFETSAGFVLPELPGMTEHRLDGSLGTLTTGNFGTEVREKLQAAGATILAVDNMTLEEIFVAEVMSSRGTASSSDSTGESR
ncbi:MAG: ABC transporter ATP-binding protein [Xanthomonadales bacterium]|nr:ABC transporter ATP-binding protein [Xanthomonadales bacterium]